METEEINLKSVNYSRLTAAAENDLMKILSDFPGTIIMAEAKNDPSLMTRYAISLASAFHSFYDACHVRVPDDPELMTARVVLVKAVQQVLKNSLTILGVDAPESM